MSDPQPERLHLQQLRNQAKELRNAHKSGQADAISRIGKFHPKFEGMTDDQIRQSPFTLADAQLTLARELGFSCWPKLKKKTESTEPTSMHSAVTLYDSAAVEKAFRQDPDSLNELDKSGNPPLYTAAMYRNTDAIDFLIRNGAEVDLCASAYLDRPDVTKRLLDVNRSLVDQRTATGRTALHFAATKGAFDVARTLIEHGADVNVVDAKGNTPLLEASHGGPWKERASEPVIALLLEHGAVVDLHAAAAIGRVDLVEAALAKSPKRLDELDEDGNTALFLAARNDQFDVVKCLIGHGADVNRADAVGTAALHRTSQQCSDELIRYLIANGADAHLCCYVACGDEDGTRSALKENPESANEVLYEYPAVGYAIHCWKLGPLRILLQHGCRLSDEDQQHILRISKNDQSLLDELLAIE